MPTSEIVKIKVDAGSCANLAVEASEEVARGLFLCIEWGPERLSRAGVHMERDQAEKLAQAILDILGES